MVLKQYLACRNLNQPYHGGVGSFALQLMIVSMLQNRLKEVRGDEDKKDGRMDESRHEAVYRTPL